MASEFSVVDALFSQLLYDHALGGDSRVVHAREKQGIEASHAVPTREDIDLCMIKHVSDVQRAGHVGRRNYDRKNRSRSFGVGLKEALRYPKFCPARLDLLRFVGLGDVASHAARCSCSWRILGRHLCTCAFFYILSNL